MHSPTVCSGVRSVAMAYQAIREGLARFDDPDQVDERVAESRWRPGYPSPPSR